MILLESWISQALGSSLLLALPLSVVAGVVSFASPAFSPYCPVTCRTPSGIKVPHYCTQDARR